VDDEVGILLGLTLGGDAVCGSDSVRPLLEDPAEGWPDDD
jgi:hypothetical protein